METVIDDKQSCSIHNPCGTNGYCVDNIDDEWSCRCKFWWNGTLCDEQTNSGKQVIALGCILGAFLIVFYGLNIFYYISHKTNKPKQDTKKK
ncbi:unnamed protein product [Rotaria magnacalcarata]|nr:unnamed protein product [Rotaria magnacalcarata]